MLGHFVDYLKAEYQHIYTAVHRVLLLGRFGERAVCHGGEGRRLYFLCQAVVRTSVRSAVRVWKALKFLSAENLLSSHVISWEWVFTAIKAQ